MSAPVILLVEDNPDDEALMLRALKKKRIANPVVVARDGVEALEYLHGTGPHVGRDVSELPVITLLDLKLPRLDGLEVLRRLRADERTRIATVVVLTTSGEQRDMVDSYSLGANSYVQKPVEYAAFEEAVDRLGTYWLLVNKVPSGTGR